MNQSMVSAPHPLILTFSLSLARSGLVLFPLSCTTLASFYSRYALICESVRGFRRLRWEAVL